MSSLTAVQDYSNEFVIPIFATGIMQLSNLFPTKHVTAALSYRQWHLQEPDMPSEESWTTRRDALLGWMHGAARKTSCENGALGVSQIVADKNFCRIQ